MSLKMKKKEINNNILIHILNSLEKKNNTYFLLIAPYFLNKQIHHMKQAFNILNLFNIFNNGNAAESDI